MNTDSDLDHEYKILCHLCAEMAHKTEKFSTEWKIFSKIMRIETTIKVEGEISYIWDDGTKGVVAVSLVNWRDDNLCRELAEPLLKVWQAKIDALLKRVEAWEQASGKEFDRFV